MSSAWFTELYREICQPDRWSRCEGCQQLDKTNRLQLTDDEVLLCPTCMKLCVKETESHFAAHPEDELSEATND